MKYCTIIFPQCNVENVIVFVTSQTLIYKIQYYMSQLHALQLFVHKVSPINSFRWIILFLFMGTIHFNFLLSQSVSRRTITGIVLDQKTKETLPGAHIIPISSKKHQGTVTDVDGKFTLYVPYDVDTLVISFTGYHSEYRVVEHRSHLSWTIHMKPQATNLDLVEIKAKPKKYSNKDNPAVILIRKAIAQKDKNRIEAQECYEYRKHEKMQLSLYAVEDSSQYIPMQNLVPALFRYADTIQETGQIIVPVYLQERLSTTLYHKQYGGPRTIVEGVKDVELTPMLDLRTLENLLNGVFGKVNIYDDNITVMNKKLMSPMNSLAPNFYKFFIIDTLEIGGDSCVKLSFMPRNFQDMGFTGTLYLMMDSTHAVKKLELGLTENINLNFVEHFNIQQSYTRYDSVWVLENDLMSADFDFYGIYGHGRRKNIHSAYRFNQPLKAETYGGMASEIRLPKYNEQSELFWQTKRIEPLTPSERKCYTMFQDLEQDRTYIVARDFLATLISNYWSYGIMDWGPVMNTISFNNLEGLRLRLGGKTNQKLSKHVFLDGFLAYGFKDKRFKYRATGYYSFNEHRNHPWEFPMNLLTVTYSDNSRVSGQGFVHGEEDRIFLSLGRGNISELLYEKQCSADWTFETQEGFLLQPHIKYIQQEVFGNKPFTTLDGTALTPLITAEAGIRLRLAPGERFVQNQKYRATVSCDAWITELTVKKAFPNLLGSQYSYTTAELSINKQFFLSAYGQLEAGLKGGYLFGQAPYTALFTHLANSNIAYQKNSFNTMNYLEFLSDEYVETTLFYHMNGLLFNRIPLLKKLHWRELLGFKLAWGNIRNENHPDRTQNKNLIPFPKNDKGENIPHTLSKQPFMEYTVGIDNIFNIFQVCFVRRLSYLDHDNISPWSIRVNFHAAF